MIVHEDKKKLLYAFADKLQEVMGKPIAPSLVSLVVRDVAENHCTEDEEKLKTLEHSVNKKFYTEDVNLDEIGEYICGFFGCYGG